METDQAVNESSQAIPAHLSITQSVIQRMAANSTSCKTWCVTLVSAILVIVADKGNPQYTLIAVIPTFLFLVLDSYYLTLEKMFRQSYNAFITKLHTGSLRTADLFAVTASGNMLKTYISSLRSFSIWPFYATLLGMIWLVKAVVVAPMLTNRLGR